MNDQSIRSTGFRKTGDPSAVDVLVQQIKTYIQENDLSVGDHLPSERELGERFDAARNTIREAVGVLKAYGVVDVRPKVGAVIVNRHLDAVMDLFSFQLTLSPETFLDIQSFRKLIEVGSVDMLFAAATETDVGDLQRINSALLSARTAEEAAQRDFDFHSALVSIAGNRTILAVYSTMKPIITRLMETGKATDGVRPTYDIHAQIIAALEARDRLAFKYLMSSHLDHGLQFIEGSVKRPPTTAKHPEDNEPLVPVSTLEPASNND